MKAHKNLLFFSISLFFGSVAFAQSPEFKCDFDRFKNSHNDNTEFNNLIDNACNEISLNNYQHARALLAEAIKVDSLASNGIINSYIESQYRKLKRFIEESGALDKPAIKNNTEESKAEKNTSPEEPVKQNTQTETNRSEAAPSISQKETTSETYSVTQKTETTVTQSPEQTAKSEEENPESVVKSETSTNKEEANVSTKSAASGRETEITAEPGEKKFSPEMMEDFHNKGMQKVRQLETFVYQIGSKTSPANIAMTSTENALKLFDSEERSVQVSSTISGTKNKYKIKTYLQRLRNLNYSDVKIEWADFQYASDFIKGSDGNYHGYIVFQQRFSAMMENMNTYTDITTKKIEVILKFYEKAQQGELTQNWDVLLGDISVVQTEKN